LLRKAYRNTLFGFVVTWNECSITVLVTINVIVLLGLLFISNLQYGNLTDKSSTKTTNTHKVCIVSDYINVEYLYLDRRQ